MCNEEEDYNNEEQLEPSELGNTPIRELFPAKYMTEAQAVEYWENVHLEIYEAMRNSMLQELL